MKILIILSAVIFSSSCSSVYRSGQTPDDLYAANPKKEKVYVRQETRRDAPVEIDAEDRISMMAARNARWRQLEYDYYYDYDLYNYRSRVGYYGYNQVYIPGNYHYSPYYTPYSWYSQPIAFSPVKNTTPRKVHLGAYQPVAPLPSYNKGAVQTRTYTPARQYNEDNNSGSRTRSSSSESRSYTPEPNKSSPPAGAPVARPGRGG